jgi:hypothetical protein
VGLLLKNHRDVKSHWSTAASDLGGVLPGLKEGYRAYPAGGTVVLKCREYPDETALRFGGTIVPIVPLIETTPDEMPYYWIGWHEEWDTAGRRWKFHSSALTVFYGPPKADKRQLIRAEWAGVTEVKDDLDVLPGEGAAHPHWHIDALRGYFSDLRRQTDEWCEEQEFRRELKAISDFVDVPDAADAATSIGVGFPELQFPTDQEMGWMGIHLAANARWCDELWPGPAGPHTVHAAGPRNLESIRRWLTSCVRYLQAQIQEQLLGQRR